MTEIKTPAQALEALQRAQFFLKAVQRSDAFSCAPTQDPRHVEWTESQGNRCHLLLEDIRTMVGEMGEGL